MFEVSWMLDFLEYTFWKRLCRVLDPFLHYMFNNTDVYLLLDFQIFMSFYEMWSISGLMDKGIYCNMNLVC